MVSGKIINEAGWKKLTASQYSKRHFFPQNTDSSCCGGALLSEEQCKLPPDRVKDNAEGNCPKCQKLLKDNPDLKRGYVEPSDDEVKEPKPSSKKTEPDPKKETTETSPKKVEPKKVEPKKTEPKKVTEKTEKPAKKPAKAQVETPEKQKKEDKSTTEKTTEKKPSTETKEPKKPKTEKVEKEKKPKKEKPKKEPKLRDGVPTQVISPFTSVDELIGMAKTLDKAEARQLVAASKVETTEGNVVCGVAGADVISPKAIWNVSRQRLSTIVSDEYSLVQHQDVVKLVGKGLKAIDTEVYGTLKNVEDVMIIEVFFPKLHLKDDTKGVDVGGKIINSYNKSRAFKGHMMANRKVCSNGMYLRKVIPDVEFFEIHVGDLAEKIPEMVQDFFNQLKEATSKVNKIIESAMEATIEFDSEDQIEPTIAGILSSPMHAKRIVEQYYKVEDKLNPTVWELYNSITNYISHAGLVESRVDDLSNKAEKLLDEKYQIEILEPEAEESA